MERKVEQIKWTTKLSKYFAQGIMFSVTFIALSIVWPSLFEFLIPPAFTVGAGLIIGFLILSFLIFWSLYLIGLFNRVLAEVIWNVDTRYDWKSLVFEGFLLFITVISVQSLPFLIYLGMPSLVTAIALFIICCFIIGFLSKTIAERYEITGTHSLNHSFFKHLRNKSRKFIALVIITIVSIAFLGYVCWSLVVSFSNIATFTGKLQKDGFGMITTYSSLWPYEGVSIFEGVPTIVCNQTQFIYEASLINHSNYAGVYLLAGAHFCTVGYGSAPAYIDYEYTPPLPSPFDSMIIWWLSI